MGFQFQLTICVCNTNDAYPHADKPRDIHNCTENVKGTVYKVIYETYSRLKSHLDFRGRTKHSCRPRGAAGKTVGASWARPRETLRDTGGKAQGERKGRRIKSVVRPRRVPTKAPQPENRELACIHWHYTHSQRTKSPRLVVGVWFVHLIHVEDARFLQYSQPLLKTISALETLWHSVRWNTFFFMSPTVPHSGDRVQFFY